MASIKKLETQVSQMSEAIKNVKEHDSQPMITPMEYADELKETLRSQTEFIEELNMLKDTSIKEDEATTLMETL
ncbi:hypothetical protein PanWU01x14_140090 [Parasponia andersonii]|uniref:Uncharacterized protein n=1 Tax=Parasponia andersonii TaxID=3476 RepID=A0A2P5CM80_PARAD|nr:hypothetical protein PanWU01x14_140090 [Parasponia andersonii]